MTCKKEQIGILMKYSKTCSQIVAAAKAGMSPKTARKYLKNPKQIILPKAIRSWRTRQDHFAEDWPAIEELLSNAPGLQAKTILNWLIEQYPQKYNKKHLRSLQRKFKEWKALKGNSKDIIFPQKLYPGRQSQSDCTCMNSLNITISNEIFNHLLFHFMLPYSCWETVSICFSESLDSLTEGYEEAVWQLGAVVSEHRTDNLTAATHHFGSTRVFNDNWVAFLSHYGVTPSRNNPGESHENGSVEKSHDLLKQTIDQQLMLRGSRDFCDVLHYQLFLAEVIRMRNCGREQKLAEEYKLMLPLPDRKWNAPKIISARVSPSSTVTILKGVYSVPSRLISLLLRAHVYAKEIVLHYGDKEVQRMPRLPKEGGANINYRHIIGHLLRKPAAFNHYQYHDSLFPRPIFRQSYDILLKSNPVKGSKQYLEILNYSAITNEQDVAIALEQLIEAKILPLLAAIKGVIEKPKETRPSVKISRPNLTQYDSLIGQEKTHAAIH